MKKVALTLAAVAFVAFTFTSCKKEYTCCYYDAAGVKLETSGFGCATSKMKKKDMQSLEDSMNAAAKVYGWSAKCE